jgi:HEAT repeat protein
VRASALSALVQSGSPDAFAVARLALADKDPAVSQAAAYALMGVDSAESRELLRQVVKTGSPEVRAAALYTVGRDGGVVDVLLEATGDKDPQVRAAALSALAENGSPAALDGLIDASQRGEGETRAQAMAMLGNADDARAGEALRAGVSDRDPQVAEAAIHAATWTMGAELDPLLRARLVDAGAPLEVRTAAALALRQRGVPLSATDEQLVEELAGPEDGFGGLGYGGVLYGGVALEHAH